MTDDNKRDDDQKRNDDKDRKKLSDEELKDISGGDGKKGLSAVDVKVV
ncbi:MAG: hypothetical protein OSB09_09990 [Planctomycetota bacterium]|nr:hypothetical protein [Planctomycetota bacterium]